MKRTLLLLLFALSLSYWGWGQVSMTTTGSSTQDFNTLATSGSSNAWTDNSTIANWYSQRTGTGTTYSADAGSGTAGTLYSYGTGTATDRALGSIGSSNAAAGNFAHGVLLRNTSGTTITDIKVTYTLEQWRKSGVTAAQSITVYYKTSSSSITALNPNNNGTWTQIAGLSLSSPINTSTGAPLDGNATANKVTATNISIPSLSLNNNDYIMIKWEDPDHSGSDHGLSIDDVTINWTVTNDITAPTWTSNYPKAENASPSGFTAKVNINEPGTAYFVIVPNGATAPTSAQVKAGQDASGTPLANNLKGTIACAAASTEYTLAVSGLTASTDYDVYFVAEDDETTPNLQASPVKVDVATTADASSSSIVESNGGEQPTISSLINDATIADATDGINVWNIYVQDGGASADADTKPTIYTGFVFYAGELNTVSNYTNTIQAAALFDNTTLTKVADALIGSNSLTFNGFTYSVADGGLEELTLLISLKTTVTDNQKFQFSLVGSGITTESSNTSSQIDPAMLPIESDGSKNVISVVATKLAFIQQPSNTLVNVDMSPAVTVQALDANNNRDLDASAQVTITSTGTLADAQSNALSSGLATFGNIMHSETGTELALTAEATGLTSDVSSFFDIFTLPKIFFSEYLEGSSNNKAIEIYNGENTAIDLTLLTIRLYSNGSSTPGNTWNGTSGTLESGKTLIIYNSGSTLTDITKYGFASSTVTFFNGDDALDLAYNGVTLDVIGQIGVDPGIGWDVAGTSNGTADKTLVRKLNTAGGTTDWSLSAGTNESNSQWVVKTIDYTGNLGSYGTAWTGSLGTAWGTAGNWDIDVPSSTDNIIIPQTTNDPLITDVNEANNLLLKLGAVLSIDDGGGLTIGGTITNDAGPTGLIIQSGATLMHNTDGVAATMERVIASDNGYHFIAVPFSGTMPAICNGNFAPLTSSFDETTGLTYDFFKWAENVAIDGEVWTNLKQADWSVNTTDFSNPPTFVNGKGYAVRYFADFSGSAVKSTQGTLSNGSQSIGLTADNNKLNLVGNTFSSPIDWKAASGWGRSNLAIDGNSGNSIWVWNSVSGNYGTYSTATDSDAGTLGVTRYIAPSQGFFVKAETAGSLTLNNSVRVNNSAAFLKNTDNSIRMKVSTTENTYSDEVLIEFGHTNNNGGSAKWWSMYASAPSLYTVKNDHNYSINHLTDVANNPEISVNFKAGVNGTYSITTAFDPSVYERVTLVDLLSGNSQELTQNPAYTFTASTTDAPNRFKLTFGSVGIDNPATTVAPTIYTYANQLYISRAGNATVEVINMAGQVSERFRVNETGTFSRALNVAPGTYVVRVISGNTVRTERIVIN